MHLNAWSIIALAVLAAAIEAQSGTFEPFSGYKRDGATGATDALGTTNGPCIQISGWHSFQVEATSQEERGSSTIQMTVVRGQLTTPKPITQEIVTSLILDSTFTPSGFPRLKRHRSETLIERDDRLRCRANGSQWRGAGRTGDGY